MIAAGDVQTARAGAQILRAGGNAVDAVCGAAFASFVCELPLTSPAGGGLLVHGAPDRGWGVLDFFARIPGLAKAEPRPRAADDLDFSAVEVDFGATTQVFHAGRGAAAVPGALAGLLSAHRDHGRLPLREVVEPALRLARGGYRLSAEVAWVIGLLEPIMTRCPATLALVSTEGRLARAGDRLRNPGLARLLEGLARDSAQTLRAYEADLLEALGPHRGGLLTPADLSSWVPAVRPPLRQTFRETSVLMPPPPSAGGTLVALGLGIAETEGLLTSNFGDHWLAWARLLAKVSDAHRPQNQDSSLGGTTHISVLDGEGGAASLTTSNGEGSGHTLEAWGVHLNNFLGEEDINPTGFHVKPPGMTMPTMMTPALALRQGRPVLVLGSGGSNRIRSAVLAGLVNRLGYGLSLSDAIRADRLHVEGKQLWFESASMPLSVVRGLEAAWPGSARFEEPNLFFGGIHATERTATGLRGAADARRGGAVCGSDEI